MPKPWVEIERQAERRDDTIGKFRRQLPTLAMVGQTATTAGKTFRFTMAKDLDGGTVLTLNAEHVKLTPRQAVELAIELLRYNGIGLDPVSVADIKGASLIKEGK